MRINQSLTRHVAILKFKPLLYFFYGRNVTITFKAYNRKNATALLVDSCEPAFKYEPHHHDNQTDDFIFILLQNKTARKFHDYYVKYDKCPSGAIRFEMREPPALGPRNDIEGCNGCLIASVGDKTDSFKNRTQVIGCSMSNANSWTVFITINNKSREARYSHGKYGIDYTVEKDDHMTSVECSMTFQNLTLVDTAILYLKGISTTQSQSPKPDLTNVVSSLSTKHDLTSSAHITQSSTGKTTNSVQSPKQSVTSVNSVPTTYLPETTRSSQTSSAQSKWRINDTVTMQSKQTKQTEVETDQFSTRQSLTIRDKETASGMFVTESIENDVLNTSTKKNGNQLSIIATVCGVLVCVIAVIIAVVCVKRKGRTTGYARIEGAECQYAVVNKPKKPFAPQAIQTLDVENKFIVLQSQPNVGNVRHCMKHLGAGELIYADLDKEALTAKPTNPTSAGILERPSTPTEYVGIDFARTVALQDVNKQDE